MKLNKNTHPDHSRNEQSFDVTVTFSSLKAGASHVVFMFFYSSGFASS